MKVPWMLVTVTMVAAVPAAAQSEAQKKKEAEPPIRFVCTEQPSIRAGIFRLDLHLKLQSDFRTADQDLEHHGGAYETEQKRIGITGRITDRVRFEIERELREDNAWRDVFVNVEIVRAFEVRAGKFKVPFSYDQLTGPSRLDFAYRSLMAETIAPARDIGVMIHGQGLRRIVSYQVGTFRHDGENARLREPVFRLPGEAPPKSQRSLAARVTAEPLRHSSGPRELRRLYVGVAATSSDVPEGLNSLRGRSLFGTDFAERVYVLGQRRRLGTEAVWMPGPFSVKAEYARATEQRKRQGLLDDDISPFVSAGWYVSGTWAVTGESKSDNIEPRAPIFQGGFGAVELAARYERMMFSSDRKEGTPLVNPRADPLPESLETIWSFGVNWYLNKWGKVVVNGIRERFEIPEDASVQVRKTNWAAVARLQFVM